MRSEGSTREGRSGSKVDFVDSVSVTCYQVISTKLPIVKDLIEIITLVQMCQNDMKMVLDRYTAIQEGFGVKPRL